MQYTCNVKSLCPGQIIREAVKTITTQDTLQSEHRSQPEIYHAILDQEPLESASTLVDYYETNEFIFIAYCNIKGGKSTVHLHRVLLVEGYLTSMDFIQIHNVVTAMKLFLNSVSHYVSIQSSAKLCEQGEWEKEQEKLSERKKQQNSKQVIALGTIDGVLKLVNVECNAVVRSIRVDTKPIRQIVHGTGSLFLWYSILFVLVDDYTIYMIDAFREVVIHIFLPTLLLCDSGLSITLDLDGRYLLEATSGGYLLVWEIPEQICKNMEYMTSKKIKKEYSLFPKYVNHSIAIDGIIWADLFGCLIGIITTKGLFRLVALDLQSKDKFVTILQYLIPNGNCVKKAILHQESVIFCMDVNGVSTVEMIEFSEDLRIHRHLIVKIVRLPNIKDFFLSPSKVLLCRSETLLTVEPSMKLFTRSASAKSEQIDDDY